MEYKFLCYTISLIIASFLLLVTVKKSWFGLQKNILLASLFSSIVVSTQTLLLKLLGVISYQNTKTVGIVFRDLPLEQYLLHFSLSVCAISIFEVLQEKFPNNNLQKYSLALSNFLLGICIAFLFFAYSKWYVIITFSATMVVILAIEYLSSLRFMYKAYRTFLVMLIPFYIIYSYLISDGILLIKEDEAVGFSVLSIPVETHFTLLITVLLCIFMFEYLKPKKSI